MTTPGARPAVLKRPGRVAPPAGMGALDAQTSALVRNLWASSQAVALQAADYRLVDCNPAFAALVGRSRDELLGCDPLEWQTPDEQALNRAQRQQACNAALQGRAAPTLRHRFFDAQGRERWMSVLMSNLAAAGALPRWLSLVQDHSAEQQAKSVAQRAELELAQWFELSSSGMLVYEDSGLVVRFNRALEALLGSIPPDLRHTSPELQALLGWQGGALSAALQPGAPALETQAVLRLGGAGAPVRHLSARLGCLAPAEAGAPVRRVLAVVQDRSAEDERDLAQLEMGMLMDTASIGVATFDPGRGWLGPALAPAHASTQRPRPQGSRLAASSGALLGIGRDLVEPDSLPEFERLQRAMRQGERTEVRYAVLHPEMGRRWLLTRVEPAALAGGRNTTSIVTLDVTDQEAAQRRNEQLLRELTTILDTSTAGIAYLRGPALVRCNRRFERMLGFEPGGAAGASLPEILARSSARAGEPDGSAAVDPAGETASDPGRVMAAAAEALAQGLAYEIEISHGQPGVDLRWYSLSLRRAGGIGPGAGTGAGSSKVTSSEPVDEAVAVLTDITRLKLQQSELEQLLRDRELMFSLSEVGIVYQRGARIERANQAMAAITGWGSSELSTLDAAELYEGARDCVEFEARIAHGLRERGRFSAERKLKRRDGSLRWVQVAVRPVNTNDIDAGVICSFVDVDERRRARQSLASQAERTRSMLNSVLVGIVTVSERGIEWMNRSARRMFAGDLADFFARPISDVATPEEDHPLRRTDWLQHLQTLSEGQAETFECRLRGRDGREFWVVGSAVLTSAGQGGEQEITFALLDIERRRQAEVSIAQAKASLQRVIETAPLAIALFDARTLRVRQLNQTAGEFFGRPLLALAGSTPQEMCEPAQASALELWLREAATARLASEHEWHENAGGATALETQASPHRVWDCRIAPLDEDEAGVTQLLLVASDVTHQREAERARLQAAIDQREVLVREVHHRIKNNLQGVAGLLQQNAARRPELAGVLNEAVGQVQAIAQVHGLQVGGGKPLEIAGLLRAIALSVQRTFGCPVSVALEGRVPHLLPEAESIPVALTVNELLTNAIKHGHGEGVLCTLIGREEGVCIRISGRGQLAPGFDLKRVPAGVSGLGLVRALLPKRTATLALSQQGSDVVAEVELRPPSVRWPDTEPRHEHDQRQLEL